MGYILNWTGKTHTHTKKTPPKNAIKYRTSEGDEEFLLEEFTFATKWALVKIF